MRYQFFQTCSTDAAGAGPEPRMANDQRVHLNKLMTLELALEVSEMQEMTFLLHKSAFSSRLLANKKIHLIVLSYEQSEFSW